tara:strand:- start:26 stop:280 length:255 start_codon:yes stop_codon:yes gene_type:complete
MVAGGIARALGIAPSSLSFHLNRLVHAELVVSRREGRQIIYAANFDTMEGLMAFLTENCCRAQGGCVPPAGQPESTPELEVIKS